MVRPARGIGPRTQPTPNSAEGEQRGRAARGLPRGIDPGFPTQLFSATGPEAEGWPTRATPTPPIRVVPPQTKLNHPYYRVMFDCETYALDNKSVVYVELVMFSSPGQSHRSCGVVGF